MAVTQDPRYGTNRWSAGTDPWPARAGWNALLDLLTTNAAIFAEGLFSARPAFSAAKKGTFYWASDQQRLYYQSATAWTEVSPIGGGGIPMPVTNTGVGAEGTSRIAARADHIHPDEPWLSLPGIQSGWASVAQYPAQYRRTGTLIEMRGAVYATSGGPGALDVVAVNGALQRWSAGADVATSSTVPRIFMKGGDSSVRRNGWLSARQDGGIVVGADATPTAANVMTLDGVSYRAQ